MDFADFAARAAAIEGESADLETIGLVADLFGDAGEDLGAVARFVQGRIVPAHDDTKLDVGPTLCYEALARAAGRNVSAADVEAELAAVGEIGAVAESLDLGGQRGLEAFGDGTPDPLTVAEVQRTLRSIATASGGGSTDTKRNTLFGLFNRAEPLEARYLARLVLGEMRIGVGEGTVRDAVAEAFEASTEAVERALQVSNDCGVVARTAREDGEAGLSAIRLRVGRPVKAMLAQTGTAIEAIESWGDAAVETKFDGVRVQIHYDGETPRLFSRNLEDVTDSLPEVVDAVERSIDVPAILDGEVVAVDPDGTPLPFQEVLRRFRRKHDVAAAREDVAVELHAFDCLHVDGEDLLDTPLERRHERLRERLPDAAVDLTVSDDPDAIADLESEALSKGHEGIMLKNPESTYTPGKRGQNWLKRKPDVETLDLVVTGAEWGEGRRANLFGTFVVSVRTDDGYEPVGKVATGITDGELETLHERLEPHVRSETGTEVDIEPAVVFEVGYEEIQRSPTYGSGYALRFPRFVGIREDKSPADADSLERLRRLYS
ncbi:ATP-dependent DNA ligase [Natronomonas sp. F2-12]|jgi:DNA ligase-1|uniref:DNA ligase n=1 Tax=Natronomonas aquatica TaxID=2841590 RepID=A0A9R1CRV5_9EURY|nr:ATP-dependent DNA ligase LigA [Natronomonas aquatica]MCQ4332544.1 ATP-dependent DNA ligase [Natronomonas aquatica]